MKRGLLVLALALAAAAAGFATSRWLRQAPVPERHEGATVVESLPGLEWLRRDLRLTDQQFAAVRDLHVAYLPYCADMCHRIAAANARVAGLASRHTEITPELDEALRAQSATLAECRREMLRHLYQTAGTLDPDQSRRYLATMLPIALQYTHRAGENQHAH